MTEKLLSLVIERPNRGPQTHRVGVDLTLDEMRRIAEGDQAMAGEVWAAILMSIHATYAISKLPFVRMDNNEDNE